MFDDYNTEKMTKLFDNVSELDKHVAKHKPCTIKGVKLKNKEARSLNLSDVIINKANWENTDIRYSNISNTTIENSTFTNVNFSHSQFRNVTFKNVTFIGTDDIESLLTVVVWFDDSSLQNVRFIGCKFKSITMRRLKASSIEIEKSELNGVDLDESKIQLNVKNSHLNYVEPTSLKNGSNFNMQGGSLNNAEFDSAHIDEFKLDGVETKNLDYCEGAVKQVLFKNSTIDANMRKTDIDTINISSSKLIMFAPGETPINEVTINDCEQSQDVSFYGSKIKKLNISNCKVDLFSLSDADINELHLTNFFINTESFSDHFKANTVKLDRVKFSGNIDFSGAHIQNLYIHNFIDGHPKIKLDGSNLEYNAHGLRLKGVHHEVTPDLWIVFHAKGNDK